MVGAGEGRGCGRAGGREGTRIRSAVAAERERMGTVISIGVQASLIIEHGYEYASGVSAFR